MGGAGFVGLFTIPSCHPYTLLWAIILWPITGMGITAGVHRLWSHRSYKATFPLRVFLMLLNTIANQGSIWHWARDHRVHHKHSETDADPHNAKRGFFFSHVGWLLVKKDPKVIEAGKKINMNDLLEMPEVVLQKKLDPLWNLFWCFIMPALVAKYGFGETFMNGLLVAGVFKYVVTLHVTWCVNSFAHLFGDHPYEEINPAENRLVALFSIGEGWHNWHHAFPYDYAASELGISQQFNP